MVKTVKFKKPNYIGDPRNAIKIFNEKEVDELVFLDISASKEKRAPNFRMLEEIASECFMPVGYGGGIRSLEDVKRIFNIGIEKVIFNTACLENPALIKETVKIAGSQSVVASIDVKMNWQGHYMVYAHRRKKKLNIRILDHAKNLEDLGVGEILLNSVDRDGTYLGYDLALLQKTCKTLKVPVIACGGASKLEDFRDAIQKGNASAVAAGSLFVYHGDSHHAVLINYPTHDKLKNLFKE